MWCAVEAMQHWLKPILSGSKGSGHSEWRNTAVHRIQERSEAVTKLLCDVGADKVQAMQNGAIPLYVASQTGHEAVEKLPSDACRYQSLSPSSKAAGYHVRPRSL